MDALRSLMASNLERFERRTLGGEEPRAAVAILVSPKGTRPGFALTRRASHLRRNAGNYALPGGHLEPGETPVDAALRETFEELGVRPGPDAALGCLDDYLTLSGRVVTPVVLCSPTPLAFVPDLREVAQVWHVPLSDLDHPEAPRMIPSASGPSIPQMRIMGRWINAPTAAWLYQFREVALRGRPERLDGFGQPAWTAR